MPAQKLKIHFIGIGGIGVSALAQYYLTKGHEVSGSDLVSSEITEALKKKGAKISIGKNVFKKDVDLIIYSPAIPVHAPSVHILSYPEALGELTKKHFTIAVAGTHGKSTTTAMIGILLTKAGLDPTVIVGTKVKEFGNSNCRVGKSQYLVIEADEHFASFLNYWPKIIVLTNIEKDHLDYYKNYRNILRAFRKFIGHLPKDGVLLDLRNPTKLWDFVNPTDRTKLKKILKVPGEHNVSNALAALTTARTLGISDKISFKALAEFRGTWRRFEITQRLPFTLVSDYGHHPTEITATLKAAREKWPQKKIWCIYQPHQYQRTYYLFKDFVKTFREAPIDKIIITDIYDVAGREEKKIKKMVNSQKLVKAIKKEKVIYSPKNKIVAYSKRNLRGQEIVIVMGAGDIYRLTFLLKRLKIKKMVKK